MRRLYSNEKKTHSLNTFFSFVKKEREKNKINYVMFNAHDEKKKNEKIFFSQPTKQLDD
jgi:hypothetical protein